MVGDPLYELNFKNATLWDGYVFFFRSVDHIFYRSSRSHKFLLCRYVWTYATTFDMSAEKIAAVRAAGGSHVLVFDGVKMGATITVNGKKLGQTTDQFLRCVDQDSFTDSSMTLHESAVHAARSSCWVARLLACNQADG